MDLTNEAHAVLEATLDGERDIPEELHSIADKWEATTFEDGIWESGDIDLADILTGADLFEAQKAVEVLREVRDLWYRIKLEY